MTGWFDDCAMYASAPVAPTMGTPTALSTSSIRWNLTDNSNNEMGFEILNAARATVASAAVSNGSGSSGLRGRNRPRGQHVIYSLRSGVQRQPR